MTSRKVLDSRARAIIIKVDDYFVKEKEEAAGLLQDVSRLVKCAEMEYVREDVVIPKHTLMEILGHLQNTTKVTERVHIATGIAKNTVAKIRREKEEAAATGSGISTPIKRTRGKIEFLDESALSALEEFINSMYTEGKKPSMREILALAQQELDYKGSETTLRKRLKGLGFQFSNVAET